MLLNESEVKSKLILAKNLNFSESKIKILDLFVKEVLSYNKKYNLISNRFRKKYLAQTYLRFSPTY